SYYVLTGVGLLWIHRRLVEPRLRHDGWLARHRILSVFLTGFIAGLPLNALTQFFWLKVCLFVTATVVRLSAVLLPIAVFSLLRISGHTHTTHHTHPAYDRYRCA
ncbi:MAG: hypothetical protein QOH91_4099, partial [Mycobacterium sp.]|nr:hypothetical protein [Mycobacterium sp.]